MSLFICARCGEPIYNDDWMFNGEVVCEHCYEEIYSPDTQLKYIADHPKIANEYLTETLYSPAPYGTRAKEILEDIVHWSDTCVNPDDHEYMRFSDWVMRWY